MLFWVLVAMDFKTFNFCKSVKTKTQNRSTESPRPGAQSSHSCLPGDSGRRRSWATREPRATGRQHPTEPSPGPPVSIADVGESHPLLVNSAEEGWAVVSRGWGGQRERPNGQGRQSGVPCLRRLKYSKNTLKLGPLGSSLAVLQIIKPNSYHSYTCPQRR